MAVKRRGEKNIFPKTSAKSRIVFNSILKTDVRPIANIRLLYIFFAYMILHRIEATLDVEQLKVQKMVFGQDDGWKNMCTTKLILDKNKKSIYQYGL